MVKISSNKMKCKLCNNIFFTTSRIGVCVTCFVNVPDYIPYSQMSKYVQMKILERGDI